VLAQGNVNHDQHPQESYLHWFKCSRSGLNETTLPRAQKAAHMASPMHVLLSSAHNIRVGIGHYPAAWQAT
jgi:hypothetical protein